MPTYSFRCPDCGAAIEEFRWYSQAEEPGPVCSGCGAPMRQEITGGTATVLDGGTGAGRSGHLPR